jgi:hypothetical protein
VTDVRRPTADDLGDHVLELIEQDEERFVEAMIDAVLEEVESLRGLPRERLAESLAIEFRRSLAALRSEDVGPSEEDSDAWKAEADLMARAGVPLEAVLQGHRVAMRRGWELSLEYAERFDLDPELLLERAQLLWQRSDRVMVRFAELYRLAQARLAQRDSDDRDAFARRLLRGTAGDSDLRERAAAYGLAPSGRYRAFRARPREASDLPRLRWAIESGAGAGGRQPLVTTIDGDLAGLAPGAPDVELDAVVALGQPTDLGAAAGSFLLASRVLETALTLGLRGAVRAEDLSLRLAVGSEEVLGDLLIERYVAPLGPLESFGATIEASVREYLGSGMRVEEAARRLHVHPNSLRHRLRRFEELTGADLHRIEDIVELWWALERRTLLDEPGSPRSPGAGD